MTGLTWNQLNRLAGYIECGEGNAVTFVQDDATRTWIVRLGDDRFFGDTLSEAFEQALAAANRHYKDVYDLEPV